MPVLAMLNIALNLTTAITMPVRESARPRCHGRACPVRCPGPGLPRIVTESDSINSRNLTERPADHGCDQTVTVAGGGTGAAAAVTGSLCRGSGGATRRHKRSPLRVRATERPVGPGRAPGGPGPARAGLNSNSTASRLSVAPMNTCHQQPRRANGAMCSVTA
jgi:hypothetical protein